MLLVRPSTRRLDEVLGVDVLLHIFALIDEPCDWCNAAATSRLMRRLAACSCWHRRLNQHFGTTMVRRGAQPDEEGLPAYVAFRKLWRAYYDGGWTPLRVDLDLLYELTWHALRERYYGHDGLRQSASYDAHPTGAHWRRCSGWLLQAASCALDPLWLAHNAHGNEGIAAVCIGTALLDCQVDSAEPPELRRASSTLMRALDACAARRLPQHANGQATGLCHLALLAVTARVAARCEADEELASLWAPAIDRGLLPQRLQQLHPPSMSTAVASAIFPLSSCAHHNPACARRLLAPCVYDALKHLWPDSQIN